MTRQRDNRSDWTTFTRRRQQLEPIAQKALLLGVDALTDREREIYCKPDTPRAKPIQHEDAHARMLAARAHRHWWAPGFTRVEHRTSHSRERDERALQGAQTGMPDFWLFVPLGWWDAGVCIRAVCELKAPELSPARRMCNYWWLDAWPGDQQSWHGLRKDQWRWLKILDGCGFKTNVAYGADQAEAFFVEAAGPEPDVMPEMWR